MQLNDRWPTFFRRFLELESSSGIILIAALVSAIAWANSPWSETYFHLRDLHLGFTLGHSGFAYPLLDWINDGLMTLFFFVVGLEIKREMIAGELSSLTRAAFPMLAALGGMLVPALIYTAFNHGTGNAGGWGIPMATDIPFALGVLALLGNRVPNSLKVFLMALAIIDDLGSILVIAIFYSHGIHFESLAAAAGVLALLMALGRMGIRRPLVYGFLGIIVWYFVVRSGVHGTIAGVLVALTVPATTHIQEKSFSALCRSILGKFDQANDREDTPILNPVRLDAVLELEATCEAVEPPLQRLEGRLHPWTSYFILPLFALANAGVPIDGALLHSLGGRVSIGILLGLVLGKPIGIFLACWAALILGSPPLTGGVRLKHLLGAGMLGGIGFTMSIFISGLAFQSQDVLAAAKLSIFLASFLAGTAGWIFLRMALGHDKQESHEKV